MESALSTQRCEQTRFTAHVIAPPDRRGQPIRGHLRACQSGYGSTPARLEIAIDSPRGARVTSAPTESLGKTPSGNTTRNGQIGGALVGGILMGIPGFFIGYSVGAGAGIARQVAEDIRHVQIPSGALLTLRL
jgi:hypothetical protein